MEFYEDQNLAKVYHIGRHRCAPKVNRRQSRNSIKETIEQNTGKHPPYILRRDKVLAQLKEGDINAAKKEARIWSDRRLVENVQVEERQEVYQDLNSFTAVGKMKKVADKMDPYYIFKANDGSLNDGIDYVFKSSTRMAKLMIEMDCSGDPSNPLTHECVFFDGCHGRVRGFKSLALWLKHPATGNTLRLANMEVRSENTEGIALFFRLVNTMLQEVLQDESYLFNLACFMCDELGANFITIQEVYGTAEVAKTRTFSCQWHFKRDAHLRANKLPAEFREKFVQLTSEMCSAATVKKYQDLCEEVKKMSAHEESVDSWLKWWDSRRSRSFAAFRGYGHPGASLAEVGNAKWKKTGKKLRLADACWDDVCTMFLQGEDLDEFYRNARRSTGRAPTSQVQIAKDIRAQNRRAEEYCAGMANEEVLRQQAREVMNPSSVIPGTRAKHRTPSNRKHFNIQSQEQEEEARRRKPLGNFRQQMDDQMTLGQDILQQPVENFTLLRSERRQPNPENPPVLVEVLVSSVLKA